MQKCSRAISACLRCEHRVLQRRSPGTWQIQLPSKKRCYASISAAHLQFGQPLHETHPHLLKPGELTPCITALEYARRRTALAASLPANSIAVLAASDIKYKSGAVFHEFHQESNFFYLTGFDEPDALAVIAKSSSSDDHVFHLYVREKDVKAEQWDGVRSGTQAAVDVFNADETGDIANVHHLAEPIISSASMIYTDLPHNSRSKSILSRLTSSPSPKSTSLSNLLAKAQTTSLTESMNRLRNIKSPAEITLMRHIGQESGRAITSAMSKQWTNESHLAAYLDYQYRLSGLHGSAYIPVVAGGSNASIIHYTSNNHLLNSHDLVLVDAGGELGNYVSDITRTFPVSGHFCPAQRDLYNAVLGAQRHCISLCRANASMSLDALHSLAETHLYDSLRALGFDLTSSKRSIEQLFPHHLGHYVGLDVHDTPGQSRKIPLVEGQCVTIEPGIYVPDYGDFPAAFRGMGIRIEDSVAVGAENPIVLTTEAVKEVEDIEALRA